MIPPQETPIPSNSVKQGTVAWFSARRGRLTSSNYGTILGINPFNGLREGERIFNNESIFTGNQACRYGTHHEDVAIADYEKACNVTVQETGFWKNANYSLAESFIEADEDPLREVFLRTGLGGSPDGIIKDGEDKTIGIIEVKCPHTSLKPKKLRQCKHYVPQVQCNMFFTDTTRCDFINWTPYAFSVESILRVDTMCITPQDMVDCGAVSNEAHIKHLVQLGLYDMETHRFVGYWRCMVQILFNFFKECLERKKIPNNESAWDVWECDHRGLIALVNNTNILSCKRPKCRLYTTKPYDIPAGVAPKRTNWTSLLAWQRASTNVQFARRERFCCLLNNVDEPIVLNGEAQVYDNEPVPAIHALDVSPGLKMTYPCKGTFVYMDIFYSGTRRHCLEWEKLPHAISYAPWQRSKSLPSGSGIICLTVQKDGVIEQGILGKWEPEARGGRMYCTLGARTIEYDNDFIYSFT
jgi:hypothetical protein